MEPKKINKIIPLAPMEIEDKRVLLLAAYAVKTGIVDTPAEFWDKINFSKNSITRVRRGLQAFTREQIKLACLLTGGNANWVYDLEKEMFRDKGKKKSATQLLEEATAAVKQELAKKKAPQRPEILN